MKKSIALLSLSLIFTLPLFGQLQEDNTFGEEFSKAWQRHKVYTLRLIEAMPEDWLNYKPTDEVRTFAELALPIAAANYGFSVNIDGKNVPSISQQELSAKGKSKQDILTLVAGSFDFANNLADRITDEQLGESVPWRNPLNSSTSRTKREVFYIMREHAAHSRGALTIYLRLKNIVPPTYID